MERNIQVNIDEFRKEHEHGLLHANVSHLNDILEKAELKASLFGTERYACISQEELDMVIENDMDYDTWQKECQEVGSLRLKGMQEERNGNLVEAMNAYADCIRIGESAMHGIFNDYAYAYERIITILHKMKENEKEGTYIEKYLLHDEIGESRREKYSKRLSALKTKNSKIQKENKK